MLEEIKDNVSKETLQTIEVAPEEFERIDNDIQERNLMDGFKRFFDKNGETISVVTSMIMLPILITVAVRDIKKIEK